MEYCEVMSSWRKHGASCYLSLDHDENNECLNKNENDALLLGPSFRNDIEKK